jgi:hypothetical protein
LPFTIASGANQNRAAGTVWAYDITATAGDSVVLQLIENTAGLRFATQNAADTYFIDKLYGGYKYVKDGIVKVDNLNFQYTDYSSPQNFADFLGSGLYNNYNNVSLVGDDRIGMRRINIDLEVIPNTNPVQMKWKMENRENWVINNQGFRQGTGPGLPNNIILVKQ